MRGGCEEGGKWRCHLGSVVAFNYACLRAKVYFVSPSHTEKAKETAIGGARGTGRHVRKRRQSGERATCGPKCVCLTLLNMPRLHCHKCALNVISEA